MSRADETIQTQEASPLNDTENPGGAALTEAFLKRAHDEETRRGETGFRQLAEAMPQIVWTARPDGAIEYFNRKWTEITGAPQDCHDEECWLAVVHPEDRERALTTWREALRTGHPFQSEHRFHVPARNEYRWFLSRALPLRDAAGGIFRWFGTCTDIDDQKRAAQQLENAVSKRTAELMEINDQLEAFVYSIAHDLRAPLRAMQAFSAALLEEYASHMDDTARNYAQRIVRSAETMDHLVMDLLAYGRVVRADMDLHPVSVEYAWIAAMEQHEHTIHEKRARIEHQLPLPHVHAHESTLIQIFANLLGNALKFVDPAIIPHIRLYSEPVFSGHVRLWIEDNGIGIAPEHHERIFRIFERLNGKNYPGTGIGLSIVRKGIERMHGRVGLESAADHGSRFWLELPRA